MGNLDRSRLAKELEPYIASQIRSALNAALGKAALPTLGGSGGVIGITPPAVLTSHVLATATGLGTYHSISGATAGHVLRASGATAAAFAQLQHGDLGGVSANQHHNQAHVLATNTALGADHSISGATAGHVLRASGATAAAFAQLQHGDLGGVTSDQHHDKLHGMLDTAHHSYTGGAALDVFGLSAASTLARLTPSDSVSNVQTAILKATNGALSIDTLTAVAKVRSPLYDTASGSITLSPAGTAVLPTGSILKDMGDYNRKWRTLFAAELYVETLVAQDVLATIGGRIMVAPTTKLIADLASGDTTMDVAHNNVTSAFVYMASAPGGVAQIEVFKLGATATPITGGYRYSIVGRNLDGTFANNWLAGDAVANIGSAAGHGWLELTSTITARNHLGPTMAIYARTGTAAWGDVKPVVAVGNLRSFVDYGADEFGFALGNDLALTKTTGFSGMTGDRTNGLRMFNTPIEMYNGATLVGKWWEYGQLDIGFDGITALADRDFTVNAGGYVRIGRTGANKPNLLYTAGGDLELRSNTTPVITLAGDGSSYFSGPMSIGAGGGIYQGTGSFASPTTGLKIWNDSGIGRLGGYSGGVLQASFSADGRIMAGNGIARMDAAGINVTAVTDPSFVSSGGYTIESAYGTGVTVAAFSYHTYSSSEWARIGIDDGNGTAPQVKFLRSTAAQYVALTAGSAGIYVYGDDTTIKINTALDTTSSTPLELRHDTTSILRSQKTSADAYLKLGNGRTVDGLAYFDLIGDTTYTSYGTRFLRNSGANGASQLLHNGTGVLQLSTQGAADMQFRTNATERMRILSDGLVKVENSIAVNGDYGGTAGYLTLTDVTMAASGAGGGTIKMNGATGRNNTGWKKEYSGTTEVWTPYWTVITG